MPCDPRRFIPELLARTRQYFVGDVHSFRALHVETEEPQADKSGEVVVQEISPYLDKTRPRRPSPYRAVNIFHLGYKNQSVCTVSGISRCLFSDKYKTHKYSVGRAYSC